MIASRGEGLDALKEAVLQVAESRRLPTARVLYGDAESHVQRLQVCLIVAADDAGVDSALVGDQNYWSTIRSRAKLTHGMFDEVVAEEKCADCATHGAEVRGSGDGRAAGVHPRARA